jgi:hypothetical protein
VARRRSRACSRPASRALRMTSPRPSCSSSGGDVADAGMQPDSVVMGSDGRELGAQGGRIGDREQMWGSVADWPSRDANFGVDLRKRVWGRASRSSSRMRMALRPHSYAGIAPSLMQRRLVLGDMDGTPAASPTVRLRTCSAAGQSGPLGRLGADPAPHPESEFASSSHDAALSGFTAAVCARSKMSGLIQPPAAAQRARGLVGLSPLRVNPAQRPGTP